MKRTNYIPLFVNHHAKVFEDLVHVDNVSLKVKKLINEQLKYHVMSFAKKKW